MLAIEAYLRSNIEHTERTWDNVIDMQEECTFNACKTAELLSVVSSIPIANWIVLEVVCKKWLHAVRKGRARRQSSGIYSRGHTRPRRGSTGFHKEKRMRSAAL